MARKPEIISPVSTADWEELRELYRRTTDAPRSALLLGARATLIKQAAPYGTFMAQLAKYCPGLHYQTLYNCRKLCEKACEILHCETQELYAALRDGAPATDLADAVRNWLAGDTRQRLIYDVKDIAEEPDAKQNAARIECEKLFRHHPKGLEMEEEFGEPAHAGEMTWTEAKRAIYGKLNLSDTGTVEKNTGTSDVDPSKITRLGTSGAERLSRWFSDAYWTKLSVDQRLEATIAVKLMAASLTTELKAAALAILTGEETPPELDAKAARRKAVLERSES